MTDQEREGLLKAIECAEKTKKDLEGMIVNITKEIADMKAKAKE